MTSTDMDNRIRARHMLIAVLQEGSVLGYRLLDMRSEYAALTKELACRADISRLPAADYEHIAFDIKRAYGLLVSEWIAYMQHLKGSYPYLYSLAVRTNPLDPDASPEVK